MLKRFTSIFHLLGNSIKIHWRSSLIAVIAGMAVPLSLAPYNFWPIAIVSVAVLFYLLDKVSSKKLALWHSWCFGLGMYGIGVSWIFVSIYSYGGTSFGLAVLMIALFIAAVAFLFALPFLFAASWKKNRIYSTLLGLPALWVFSEWLRTWAFTGFPWLFLGYGHIDTWLSGWAPVTGVMGIGFLVAFFSASMVVILKNFSKKLISGSVAGVCCLLWLIGFSLQQVVWTQPMGDPISVGMVQGNIAQEDKMNPSYINPPIERYVEMSEELWEKNDWVIWPEAAVPLIMNLPYHQESVEQLLGYLTERAAVSDSALIYGIRYYDEREEKFYNAILGLGSASGIYFKQRLVPFGEYVPLEEQLRGIIHFFNLPTSIIAVGPHNERGIQADDAFLAPSICYEIVYPDRVAKQALNTNVLVTISNDAWFGTSIGPLQHMQIAQMRALETGREVIRSTNNGVSGFIDYRGKIRSQTQQFVQQNLEDKVQLRQGNTPFMIARSWPILLLSVFMLFINLVLAKKLIGWPIEKLVSKISNR